MRTRALLLGCFLVGCSGAAGGSGANGQSGIDGKDGVDGKDGAQGPAGPAGKDAAISGSRLKAYRTVADDGSVSVAPYYWFDSALNIRCAFVTASDGEQRCLPSVGNSQYGQIYTDSACAVPAFYEFLPGCPKTGYAFTATAGSCAIDPLYVVHALGSEIPAGTQFYSVNPITMACVQSMAPSGKAFADGGVVDPSTFVAATIETDP